MSASTMTLDQFTTPLKTPSKHHSQPVSTSADLCPECTSRVQVERRRGQYFQKPALPLMRKVRLCRDYVVRCCPGCGRCFYFDQKHGRLIELAFRYKDIFGRDDDE